MDLESGLDKFSVASGGLVCCCLLPSSMIEIECSGAWLCAVMILSSIDAVSMMSWKRWDSWTSLRIKIVPNWL
jgi:hypothetical protein